MSADWFGIVLTGLTMLAAALTWWLREGSRKARDEARAARDDARAHREAAERQAAALQQVADIVTAQSNAPPWVLTHFRGDTYQLLNDSARRQYDVAVDPQGFSRISRGEYEWAEIGPRESRTFLAVRTQGPAGRNVKVTWARETGGSSITWEHPLPPKL